MKITKYEYEALCDTKSWGSREDFHKLLEELTGIEAQKYVGYQYYDNVGNYVGDSSDCSVRDLLDSAYIEIEGE
jgi:hypothetical protein